MPTVLIVGATRGLGAALTAQYASKKGNTVFATSRSDLDSDPPGRANVHWISGIDVGAEDAGAKLVAALQRMTDSTTEQAPHHVLDTVIITAGFFGKESFDAPNFDHELQMYRTSAIGPVFIVHHLVRAGCLRPTSGREGRQESGSGSEVRPSSAGNEGTSQKEPRAANTTGSKIILISSESGSLTLRHPSEGGGNYGHHASKAALNMAGKLLSIDLAERGITVGMLHPGFMRTEMTKSVGFDKFWDAGGAVTPDVAAASLIEFIDGFGMDRTGQYWAPRGPRDIGTAEAVLGKELPTPLQLPW